MLRTEGLGMRPLILGQHVATQNTGQARKYSGMTLLPFLTPFPAQGSCLWPPSHAHWPVGCRGLVRMMGNVTLQPSSPGHRALT